MKWEMGWKWLCGGGWKVEEKVEQGLPQDERREAGGFGKTLTGDPNNRELQSPALHFAAFLWGKLGGPCKPCLPQPAPHC